MLMSKRSPAFSDVAGLFASGLTESDVSPNVVASDEKITPTNSIAMRIGIVVMTLPFHDSMPKLETRRS
jgi:hypothetical protein